MTPVVAAVFRKNKEYTMYTISGAKNKNFEGIYRSQFFLPARTAFEKMTDLDYVGETYYTIRNLSLYECQGWCREEPECSAASFSFVANTNVNPPRQETVCLLQNGTQANNPSAKPIRALNQYYMVKMSIRSGKSQSRRGVCLVCEG